MSFLLRTLPRQSASLAPRARFLSTTPLSRKSATETVKETIESVNKTIGQKAAGTIEKSQEAASSVKSSGGANAKSAEGSMKEMAGEAKGKAHEMAGEAKGTSVGGSMKEMAGEAKGKAHEMAGEAKGKASELKGEAKSKM